MALDLERSRCIDCTNFRPPVPPYAPEERATAADRAAYLAHWGFCASVCEFIRGDGCCGRWVGRVHDE